MNKLSKRLLTLLKHCDYSDVWADIGCDHGYISLGLLKENKAKEVYAIDIHKESLYKTQELLENYNLNHKAKFFVGDGFSPVIEQERNRIESAIIAGMGGQEIIKILNVYKPLHLVLQPMKNTIELRKYLLSFYEITEDYILQDKNKFYDILICKLGNKTEYSEQEFMFGKTNLIKRNKDFQNYLLFLKQKEQEILKKHYNQDTVNVLQKVENALNLFK